MAINDQIKVLAQVTLGDGGGSSNADDLTSGTVALARGGTNADLSATGGTGHVLKQSSAGANITVGELTASDVQLTSPVTTGGTSTAYTLTDSRIGTPADGQVFAFRVHTANGTVPTLAVNGSAALPLYRYRTDGNLAGLAGGQLRQYSTVIAIYNSLGFYMVISNFILDAVDIPSTLNATTFAGAVTLSGNVSSAGSNVRCLHGNSLSNVWVMNFPDGGGFIVTRSGTGIFQVDWDAITSIGRPFILSGSPSSAGASVRNIHGNGNALDWVFNCPSTGKVSVTINGGDAAYVDSSGIMVNSAMRLSSNNVYPVTNSSSLNLYGGSSFVGGTLKLYGNSHATKPGIAEYYSGNATGAKHQFFDKNGAEQLRVDENGPNTLGHSFGVHGYNRGIRQFLSGSYHTTVYGGSEEGGGGHFRAIGSTHESSPSATEIQSGLLSRTASTAFKLCYYATGDMALVTVFETTIASFRVKVDSAGTVTFTNLDGGAASASIVNSSSPAAGEIGVYISSGQLFCKPGSSYAGKMAVFAQIGKA